MALAPKHYRFALPAQWQAGIADRLGSDGTSLQVASGLGIEWLAGSSAADRSALLALDPLNCLYWLRPHSFELMRLWQGHVLKVGTLPLDADPQVWQPAKLVISSHRLWLLLRNGQQARLLRHVADTLQPLDEPVLARPILDMVGDGADGVWVLQGGDGAAATLQRLSPSGIPLATLPVGDNSTALHSGRLTINPRHDTLYVLLIPQNNDTAPCQGAAFWSILSVPLHSCGDKTSPPLFSLPSQPYRLCRQNPVSFTPSLFMVDAADRLYLFGPDDSDTATPVAQRPTLLWVLDRDGQLLNQMGGLDPAYSACVSDGQKWVTNAAGIGELVDSGTTLASSDTAVPTYVTPTLVSPDGEHSGWLRAELAADFGQGTAIEISVASTRNPQLIEEMTGQFAATQQPATIRLLRVNARLPWAEGRTVIYQGLDWPAGQALSFPLQGITDTHLWLRIRIHTAAGAKPPTLKSLRVYYPDISYLRYLPAVYQENAASADMLKRLLAVMESLLGDLDAQLDALPANIHPDTAPDAWLPYLLGWLGLPPAPELPAAAQRLLLKAAPGLLKQRGTQAGLEQLLGLLVGKDADGEAAFSLDDNSAGPAPWALPAATGSASSPRLGYDTLVLVQQQPGFYLGQNSSLGNQALGYGVLDPAALFARTSGLLRLRIVASSTDRQRLQALLQRYLPYFIPAHCRYELQFVAPGTLHRYPLLNGSLVLHDAPPPRLGADTTAGCTRLEAEKGASITLGRASLLGNGPYLT